MKLPSCNWTQKLYRTTEESYLGYLDLYSGCKANTVWRGRKKKGAGRDLARAFPSVATLN